MGAEHYGGKTDSFNFSMIGGIPYKLDTCKLIIYPYSLSICRILLFSKTIKKSITSRKIDFKNYFNHALCIFFVSCKLVLTAASRSSKTSINKFSLKPCTIFFEGLLTDKSEECHQSPYIRSSFIRSILFHKILRGIGAQPDLFFYSCKCLVV